MSVSLRSIVFAWIGFALAVPVAAAQTAPNDTQRRSEMMQAISSYQLSSENVKKAAVANDNIATVYEKDPEAIKKYAEQLKGQQHSASIDELAAKIEYIPPVANAIHSAGLDTRTFLLTTLAMAQAAAYAQMAKERPQALQHMQGVNMQNVEFVNSHPAEVKTFIDSSKKLQASHERAGGQ